MKKFSVILFAILLGFGMVATSSWATSYDPTGAAGNLPVQPKSATIANHGKMGDALFGELYRAIAPNADPYFTNLLTYVSIENNSSRWVAAHVRLRTGRYSIEAIDFPILLSPHDVFWFQFENIIEGANEIVRIYSVDTGTILHSGLDQITPVGPYTVKFDPATGTVVMELKTDLLKSYKWSGEYVEQEELAMGYLEVFGLFSLQFPSGGTLPTGHNFYTVMGQLYNDTIGAKIPYGVGGFCTHGLIDGTCFASYDPNSGSNAGNIRIAAQDVGKVLTGHVFMADFQTAVYAGYTMKAIKDFRAGVGRTDGLNSDGTLCTSGECYRPLAHRDLFLRSAFTNNGASDVLVNPATIIYNYGADSAYSDPDWATTFGPTWNDGDNWYGDPLENVGGAPVTANEELNTIGNSSFSLDEVEDALYKELVSSTYFNTGFTNGPESLATYTMAVFTAPTKFLRHYIADWPIGKSGDALTYRGTLDPSSFSPRIGTRVGIWNLAEFGGRDISPTITNLFPYEVSLVPIGSGSNAALDTFSRLVIDISGGPLDVNTTDFYAGFFMMKDFTFSSQDTRGKSDLAYKYPVVGPLQNYTTTPILGVGQYLIAPQNASFPGVTKKVPVSVLMIDFEQGTSVTPRNRMYEPSWDNTVSEADAVLGLELDPFGTVGYGG